MAIFAPVDRLHPVAAMIAGHGMLAPSNWATPALRALSSGRPLTALCLCAGLLQHLPADILAALQSAAAVSGAALPSPPG